MVVVHVIGADVAGEHVVGGAAGAVGTTGEHAAGGVEGAGDSHVAGGSGGVHGVTNGSCRGGTVPCCDGNVSPHRDGG